MKAARTEAGRWLRQKRRNTSVPVISQQGALVHSSVLSHLERARAPWSCFLNRNTRDFDDQTVVEQLERYNCKRKWSQGETGVGGIEAAGDEHCRLDSIRFLEEMWGDGFLSPGGLEEVERLLCGIFGAAIKPSPARVLPPAARAR